MDVLPGLFERVKKEVPKARLIHAYGWEIYKQSHANDAKKMKWMEDTRKEMRRVGIEEVGRLSLLEIGKLYAEASILVYPSCFAEIDCLSVRKAQIAGCYPIATDFGALNESIVWGDKIHSTKTKDTWASPYQFHFGLDESEAQDKWVASVVASLKDGIKPWSERELWSSQFSWENTAARWDVIFKA